jgi:hypothetical protein
MGGTMNGRIRKLTDLEIDEVSLVDRPANQHGLVAFAKRHGEDNMTIYDADGVEVYENELEHGDVVYDDDGNELVFVEEPDGTTSELQDDLAYAEYENEDEPQFVGKADRERASTGRLALGTAFPGYHGAVAGRKGRKLRAAGNEYGGAAAGAAPGYGVMAAGLKRGSGRTVAAGYGATLAGSVAGANAGTRRAQRKGHYKVEKSLGQSVYEELSKALTGDDQAQVISKALDRVSKAEQRAIAAEQMAYELQDRAELEEFAEIAKGYGLPTDPYTLGAILKSATETMDDAQLQELDRLLTAQGALYEELGTELGGQDSQVMDMVQAQALEMVGKADVSESEAIVAMFGSNPELYDEYLAESR